MPRPATPKLSEYRRKRDPQATPEPFGGSGKGKSLHFVVQRHQARSLHYDFRLERDGVLLSWAVPKGVPLEPGQRVLAVHVEDHPLDYATFEGRIPAGQYGAGTVEIWDHGTYELVEQKPDGGMTVHLHGERLEGLWTLVPAKMGGDPKNWLLIRKHDGSEPPAERREYTPMLATLAEEPPKGPGWLYEVKWDGFRALARVRGGEATLWSRNGNDLTGRFEQVARALPAALRTTDCVLDGEVCALDERGRPSFSAMQQGSGPLVYYLFDLLELEGEPLVALPLSERRKRLEALVDESATVKLSAVFDDGEALLTAAKEQGLEGILAKRADSRYTGRRSGEWQKIKTKQSQEFVIAGYTRGHGRREGSFGALVLAVHRGGELVYAGNVGTGFSDAELDRLLALLRPLERADTPFAT
ncbi:MAG: non-homologous end-joining DNA ligase, partial [Gaiellaceae bacterium]